jgi:hypothetical protein
MADVAADVSPLIIPAGGKFEPTHVGWTFGANLPLAEIPFPATIAL